MVGVAIAKSVLAAVATFVVLHAIGVYHALGMDRVAYETLSRLLGWELPFGHFLVPSIAGAFVALRERWKYLRSARAS